MNTPYRLNRFVIADPGKCIGCRVCEIACSTVHSREQTPLTAGNMKNPVQSRLYLVRTPQGSVPVQCRHCEDAPCAAACPVLAIMQKDDVIYVDEDLCIGCKTCMLACPFGALKLVPIFEDGLPVEQNLPLYSEAQKQEKSSGDSDEYKQLHVASKCDRCLGLEEPACVANCPQHALQVISPEKHLANRIHEAATSLASVVRKYAS